MEKDKYLPTGSIIGGHYETVDILGEDDFEILYLVRDNHRRGSFFVLKELFLETFSSRNKESVYTTPQAQGVFDKRKNEIIKEVNNAKRSRQIDEVKTYGYIEDNNTIYTIMEFTNNANISNYLQFKEEKEEIVLPPLEELIVNPTTKKSSLLFLKILIVTVLIGIGLGFYANKMIKEDRAKAENKPKVTITQTPIHHPPLVSRNEDDPKGEEVQNTIEQPTEVANRKEPKVADSSATYIPVPEGTNREINKTQNSTITPPDTIVDNSDAIYIDNETEEIIDEEEIVYKDNTVKKEEEIVVNNVQELPTTAPIIPVIPPQAPKNISLGTKVESSQIGSRNSISLGNKIEPKSKKTFTRASVQNFLHGFIASSASGSVDNIVSKYDYHVDRYFSLKNVTHSMIRKDKQRYNRRWTHREFRIENFRILKTYRHDGTDYCDVKTTTKWRVSNNHGRKASGRSRGFMTIKKTDSGFKVKSIHTLK